VYLFLLLLVHEVQQVKLELHGGRKRADAHAHDLPPFRDRVRGRVARQLLHDLQVNFVPQLGLFEALLQDVLRERGGKRHGLVAHVTQQALVDLKETRVEEGTKHSAIQPEHTQKRGPQTKPSPKI
jgi:hypothetical protein